MTGSEHTGWTRTVSEFNIGRLRDEEWERDRQVVLSQLHNLLLALRSNTRFTTRPQSTQRSPVSPFVHPLTVSVRDLRERLFYPSAAAGRDDFSAEELLLPFCNVITSEETTEPITGVALAAFVAFLDLKCSFLTAQALKLMSETAKNSRSEIADTQSHEAVLARILQVYVGCSRHPNSEGMAEQDIVSMLQGAFTVATYGEPSELLRRTAEQAMNDIVTAVFERVLKKTIASSNGRIYSIASGVNLITPESQTDVHSGPEFNSSDGHVVLSYICTLISSPSQTSDNNQVSTAAVQLQGLCLAHTVLFLLKDELVRVPALLRCVRNDMCRALLRVGSNCTNVIVLSQLLRTAHLVVQFAAMDVVPQALSIIDQLHLEPLQRLLAPSKACPPMSPNGVSSPRPLSNQYLIDSDFAGNEAHEMLMESFLEFCANSSFPTFCYAHYDLSIEYKGLLDNVCKFIALCVTQSVMGATTSVPGVSMLGEESATVPYALQAVRWAEVGVLGLDGLTAMIRSIHQRVTCPDYLAARKLVEGEQSILSQLKKKKRLQDFAELFDKGEFKKALNFILTPPGCEDSYLVGDREVDCFGLGQGSSGWDIGEFLFRHKNALDRTAIGDFLGEYGKEPPKPTSDEDPDGSLTSQWEEDRRDDYKVPMTVRFFAHALKGFLNCFNCKGKPLIKAIREAMYQMMLPRESQKIDRVMETFANHWFSVNKDAGPEVNPFKSVDGAFILAFSIIMLNTDLHSGKMAKVMSKEEFKRMNRGIDDGESLPDDYMNYIYDDVKANQIVMIDMIKQGYTNDSVWTLEIMEAKSHAAHDLPIGLRTNPISQLAGLDPFVFNVMWRPCVSGLLSVLTHICAACDGVGSPMLSKEVTSLRNVWSVLKNESKKNYDVVRASSEGILRCAETAAILENVSALDFIVTSLSQQIIPSLQSWLESGEPNQYGRAGKSVLVLIFAHLLMKIVDRFGSLMDEGWRNYCEVWQMLFLCGVFSDEVAGEATSVQSPQVSVTDVAEDAQLTENVQLSLRSVLRESPLKKSFKLRTSAPVNPTHGGGWFSGLWGGNNQMLIDEQKKEQEAETRSALSRLRSAIPSLSEMLQMQFTDKALHRLIHTMASLGEVTSQKNADGFLDVDATRMFCSSYIAQLIVEIAINEKKRINFNDATVFSFLRGLMNISFSMLQQVTSKGNDREQLSFWRGITDRVVDGVFILIASLSKNEETRESLFSFLSDLTALPESVFQQVIAQPLSKLLLGLLEPPVEAFSETDATAYYPLRSCSCEGWTRLISAARMVAVRAPSQGIRLVAVRVLVLMAREASVGGWATLAHLQSLAMTTAEVLGLEPISTVVNSEGDGAYENIQVDTSSFGIGNRIALPSFEGVANQAPDALFMLHKTVTSSRFLQSTTLGNVKHDVDEWTRAWLTCIGALATLAASVPNDKIASDALLTTQRCILDDRLLLLDAEQIMQLFHSVLLPLMETICNTSIAAEKVPISSSSTGQGVISNSSGNTNVASYLLPSVLLSAVFGPMAGPEKRREGSVAGGGLQSSEVIKSTQRVAVARNDEVQCRCIGLGPKALLHFVEKLSSSNVMIVASDGSHQPLMTTIWGEVIGTLYALYSSGTADSVLLEAIQENIRNIVHVLAALCSSSNGVDTASLIRQTNPQFWDLTRVLLRPFPFSEPLLKHIDEQKLQ